MRIGFLHLGHEQHGVRRYGRLLAGEAQRRPELSVLEAEAAVSGRSAADRRALDEAAADLAPADLVHVQYNLQARGCVWGEGGGQVRNLKRFLDRCPAPLAVTLHDLYPRVGLGRRRSAGRESLLRAARRALGPQNTARRTLLAAASMLFVCSREEAGRLGPAAGRCAVHVVPHFVERRAIDFAPEEARRALGLQGRRVVSVLGVMHRRKGHDLVVRALPRLPGDVVAVFAGRAARVGGDYLRRLLDTARAAGVPDRLRVTGYLAEPELERWLAATHLAVCPFRALSASGSLSTWISAARPILASDLPQMAEYDALVPGAIRTFRPTTAAALASAIERVLPSCTAEEDPAVARLRDRLALPVVFDEHLRHYRAGLGRVRGR